MLRPISLLLNLGKTFARHIIPELNYHLFSNNMMDQRQFGFIRYTSTTDALFLTERNTSFSFVYF